MQINQNADNKFCQIFEAGIFDELRFAPKVASAAGPERMERARLGLSSCDISALRRTCQAAHSALKPPFEDHVNALLRYGTSLRPSESVTRGGTIRAKSHLKRAMEHGFVSPGDIYRAIEEMRYITEVKWSIKSQPNERLWAITFLTALHSQNGALTDFDESKAWLERMRALPRKEYTKYLKRCTRNAAIDACAVGMMVSYSMLMSYALYHLATTPVTNKEEAADAIRALPALPMMFFSALAGFYFSLPVAIGLAINAGRIAAEASNLPREMFYKDALLMQCIINQETCLLMSHPAAARQSFFDVRVPDEAFELGVQILSKALGTDYA